MASRAFLVLPIAFVLAAPAVLSQSPPPEKTFEERLVEILKERGLIDEAAQRQLLDLAARMKAEDAARKSQLSAEVRSLEASFSKSGEQEGGAPVKLGYDRGFKLA